MTKDYTYNELLEKVSQLEDNREKLNDKCDFLNSVINSIRYPFYVVDPDDHSLLMKNTIVDDIGETGKKKCYETFYGRKSPCKKTVCPIQTILDTQTDVQMERHVVDKSGRKQEYAIFASPFFDTKGGVSKVIISNIDVTELKNMEARAHEMAKIKAISTLSGGIAHQFNNSLAIISGNVELLKFDFSNDPAIKGFLNPVMGQIQKMSRLTKQLLAYSEGGKYNVNKVSPKRVITDVIRSVQHKILPNIKLELESVPNVFDINADVAQIHMAVSAIILNAVEAVGQKGTIRVAARNEIISTTQENERSGPYTVIEISDNGRGMDEECMKRIFEPFYTTNFQGRGLGMAATYGIIKNHGGFINITSRRGEGTTVRVYIPGIGEKKVVKEKNNSDRKKVRSSRNVLLIEDEEMIVEVGVKMLEKLGYQPFVAKSGKEALEISKKNKEIDIAILDIGLPDIGGRQLYPKLKKLLPSLKVMVCSGFSIDGPAREIIEDGADVFLQKPFEFRVFSQKLSELSERRNHKRFKAMVGSIAKLSSPIEFSGQIIDISKGGLALKVPDGFKDDVENSLLSINAKDENYGLDDIQCKIIYSGNYRPGGNGECGNRDRISVQFENLTMEQAGLIEHFIRKFSTELETN